VRPNVEKYDAVAADGRKMFRFWYFVEKQAGDACWLWTGATADDDYGFYWNCYAHRLAYTALHGTVPAELDLDHLCRTPSCIRPDHLEPVPSRENTLRGDTIPAANLRKTHCPLGHEYDETRRRGEYLQRRCSVCAYMKRRSVARVAAKAEYDRKRRLEQKGTLP
jgi:hypothetical protein